MAKQSQNRIAVRSVRGALLAAALAGLLVWGNRSIRTEEYTFRSPRLGSAFAGFRIVQISDLHGAEFRRENGALIEKTAAAKPDIIVLTGDLVDEATEEPYAYAASVCARLSALAPTYYITGNHEWPSVMVNKLKRVLRESGVTVLSNEYVSITRNGERIVLAGIDDPNGPYDQKTPEALAAELYAAEGDPFWLLLAHRNVEFPARYCRLGADLTLSGHAHGGIWRLPFTDGVFSTERTLFPSYTNGFYTVDGAELFVSRGLGNSPRWFLRLFNRPELAVLTLETADGEN